MEKEINIQIIHPTLSDWEKVKDLRLEALQNDPQAFGSSFAIESQRTPEEWKEKLQYTVGENPLEILVVAEESDTYIGMLGAFLKDNETWYVKATYVKSDYRGRRVAGALMKELLLLISDRKEEKNIELFVNTSQPAAVQFYKKNGFEIVETLKDQILGDGKIYDEYLMRKEK